MTLGLALTLSEQLFQALSGGLRNAPLFRKYNGALGSNKKPRPCFSSEEIDFFLPKEEAYLWSEMNTKGTK